MAPTSTDSGDWDILGPPYVARTLTLRPDAGRYECGTLNTIGCYGLKAAIEFLLQVGVDRVAPVSMLGGFAGLGEPNGPLTRGDRQ